MMKVELLTHTPDPEKIVAAAAKLCYSNKADISSLMNGITPDRAENFIAKLESSGHDSPMEHCSFTFAIEGVSRALTHQLVRHRVGASYSQRSQRYCAEDNFEYVIPESVVANGFNGAYETAMESARKTYQTLVDHGIPKEDARMVLPNAACTRIIVTMNVRELWHFFSLRCCKRAQAEIRAVANEMLRLCREASPALFKHAGPSCMKGYCPEGAMSCGKVPTLEALTLAYREAGNVPEQDK